MGLTPCSPALVRFLTARMYGCHREPNNPATTGGACAKARNNLDGAFLVYVGQHEARTPATPIRAQINRSRDTSGDTNEKEVDISGRIDHRLDWVLNGRRGG